MTDFPFLAADVLGDLNPNPSYTHLMNYPDLSSLPEFEPSHYLKLEDGSEEDSAGTQIGCHSENPNLPENVNDDLNGYSRSAPRSSDIKCKKPVKKNRVDVGLKVAFRTKSQLEVMDDGFKWRKYGKKAVKNSPHPRNYFRCTSRGCNVKKRVQRDSEDSSYVITTYEGVHNHESPCVVYYNQMPLMVPSGWTLQASHSSSSLRRLMRWWG